MEVALVAMAVAQMEVVAMGQVVAQVALLV